MDQSLALNALAPFLALAKSATAPRAAADLVTQATSAPHTYVFAELLQQPNIQALKGNEQYGSFYDLLCVFAWGTWEEYKTGHGLPPLSDAQALKLRLLSLLTISSERTAASATESNLSYAVLCKRLDLQSDIDLEHLITQAIYSNLISATLNPATQTVLITSVSPLRDLAPGSIDTMIAELGEWSTRCDSVLSSLEAEINRVKDEAQKRKAREQKAKRQAKAVTDGAAENKGILGASRGGHNTRGARRDQGEEDGDEMMVDRDPGQIGGTTMNRKGGGFGGLMGRFGGGGKSSGR